MPPDPSTEPDITAAARTDGFRIGDLHVDPLRARVMRGANELPVPKLSFDLLLALIETAPAIATIDTLLTRVWPGLVVNPETVSQRVKLLRAALGDDPRHPAYIEVIRGRGYRLIPEVERTAADAKRASDRPTLPAPGTPRRSSKLLWPIAALALIVAGLLGWQLSRQDGPPELDENSRSIAVLPFDHGSSADDTILALGIAESVLHRLAAIEDMTVIARTSSFGIERRSASARDIGRTLGARYLLEGSVQRSGDSLRITAQLIDSLTGAHVWSLQFDRDTKAVFAVQDEIAIRVAQSLQLTLPRDGTKAPPMRGTTSFDAYFEYLQARSLIATGRVSDMQQARAHLERALSLDPQFARAMVDLAGTRIRLAEYEPGPERRERFEEALPQAGEMLALALEKNPGDGRAWLERGYLNSFTDVVKAEADIRRGLTLSPSDAAGHELLASVLYQDPARHGEALAALIRASRLDPLEPRYEVTRAVFHLYGKSDFRTAQAILAGTLEKHPRYQPAVLRMGEVELVQGQLADAIRYFETALSLDGSSEQAFRMLVASYYEVRWPEAALALLPPGDRKGPRAVGPLLVEQKWVAAGDAAYAALEEDSDLAIDEAQICLALRRHARATGETARALAALTQLADLQWTDDQPEFPETFDMKAAAVGVADMLQLSGEPERARLVLRAALARMDRQARTQGQGELWTRMARAEALAMLNDPEGALRQLDAAAREGSIMMKNWLHLDLDPAFDALRGGAGFQRIRSLVLSRAAAERARLQEFQRSGVIPDRMVTAGPEG